MGFELDKDRKVLIGSVIGSIIAYNAARKLLQYVRQQRNQSEWIPVGYVKSLHIYPIKSCAPVDLFSFKCTANGPEFRGMEDRSFVLINKETGKFYTARQKPQLVLVQSHIDNGMITVEAPDCESLRINLDEVVKNKNIMRATLFENLKQDGYDCGDEASKFFSNYINEPNTRLLYWKNGLYTERTCKPQAEWWNNPVPKRKDDSGFTDLAPFLITTDSSLENLNNNLDEIKVTHKNFRPSIRVEGCDAWDEDKWAEIKIGDAELECFAPCTRCVLTTVDPLQGTMNKQTQPLKKLREFRLAPEGKMRNHHKDSPVFGVYAGMKKSAYIHVGQVVYARYKPTPF